MNTSQAVDRLRHLPHPVRSAVEQIVRPILEAVWRDGFQWGFFWGVVATLGIVLLLSIAHKKEK